ncbi:MAG: poly(A) polymerase, partial [Sandaracinaceae bacterium]|nr:poly(A) polymerase [Sandaracinaceae bacterium]
MPRLVVLGERMKEELLLSEKEKEEAQSGWKVSYRRHVVALRRLEPHPSDPRFRNGPKPALYFCRFPRGSMDPHALTVLHRLMREGYRAYLVGGCVRDLLLGRFPKDFDVATDARPGELRQLFRSNCRIIGRRFRLAHIVFGDKVIETATFRRDPGFFETDGDEVEASLRARSEDVDLLIRNDNAFGEPHEDALRRDFRMNGLFYDIEREEVIDYVEGMRDIEERVLRTIGIADLRFREDPVRILRAIRLSARLDVGIDAECWDAMVAHRHELLKAARARLFEEIMRWMRG